MGLFDSILGGVSKLFDFGASHYETNRQMHFSEDMQKQQQQYNTAEREAAQQYNTGEREATQDWNLAMWNKNNDYNSPAAQMERLQSAGLSPAAAAQAVAGQGSVASSPVTSSAQSVQGASSGLGSAPGFQQAGVFNMSPVDIAQMKLLNEQAKNVEQNTQYQKEMTEGKNMENSVFMTTWNVDQALKSSQININKRQEESLQFQVDVLFPQQQELNEQEINNRLVQGKLFAQQVVNATKEAKLIEEKVKTEQASQGVLSAQQGVYSEQKNYVHEQFEGQRLQNIVDGVKAKFAEKGVDISVLDAISQINLELYEATGGDESKIEEFWNAMQGDYSSQLKNSVRQGVQNMIGSGKVPTTGRRVKKGPNLRNGTSTTYNYYGGNSGLNTSKPFGSQ